MWREKVVHDDEVNLASSREFDAVQAVEPAQEGMWVRLDVFVILVKDGEKELVLCRSDSFDNESVVARKVEE